MGLRIAILDTTERHGEVFVGIEATQDRGLIADQTSFSIHRMRVAAIGFEVRLGARDEEAARFVQTMETLEVQVAMVHQVVGAGLGKQQIEDVDVVKLAVADMDEAGNIAAQIQQRMQLDGRLGGAERCPGKYRQAQIVVASSA